MAEVFGVAASAIALIELFAKIGVLCSIYCAGVKAAPQDIRNILNEADRCTASLRAVERLVTRPNGIKDENARNLHRNLETCRTLLDELAVKLEKGTKLGRLQWPLDKKSVTNVVKKLEQCRSAISLDLQVSQTDLLLDANQETILAKLRTVNGASYDAHNDAENTTCYADTRVEILQQIQEWGTSRDGECMFWLNGMAGTGKSTISRTVAQMFDKKKMLGASFFFKRGEGDRGRAAHFIPTIAAQLVQHLPELAEHVYHEMHHEPGVSDKSIHIQFETVISQPIQRLPVRPDPPIIVVVVDALDECDRLEHVKLITHLLSQAKSFRSVRLKFFLTSRPELPIIMGFRDLDRSSYETLILHEVPEPVIENDIGTFFEIQMARIREEYNKSVTPSRLLPTDWPGDANQRRLVELATPLFIFAATVCRFIQDRRFGSPRMLLARFLEHQGDVGSKLEATYRPVLDQLLLGLTESEKHELAQRFREIVGSIVALSSPLTATSLSNLLGIPQDTIEDQLDLLHSVLQVPHSSDVPIRLLHLSFRDFLFSLDKGQKGEKSLFSIDENKTHEHLVVKCLGLLSKRLKRDICGLRKPDTRREDMEQCTIESKLSPEVLYACKYWVEHWRLSGCRIRDDDLVHGFLDAHLLHWIEALSLIGIIWESIGLIDCLLGLLKLKESIKLLALLKDARRVILSNMSTLDEFPLQVYYSAMIFAPTGSIVRQHFLHEFPPWLLTPPATETDWGPCVQSLRGLFTKAWAAVFSPDSKLLAIATNEDTVELWNPTVGLCMARLEGHEGQVLGIDFSFDSALLASTSGRTIMIWDIEFYDCTATLEGHDDDVTDVAFKHNSRVLASGSCDNTIRIWDIATKTCTAVLHGHEAMIQNISFSPDTRFLASASSDATVKLWDTVAGKCCATLDEHIYSVESVAFSPDSTLVASASEDESIKIWDVATSTYIATLEGHTDSVLSVSFSPQSSIVASASADDTIRVWDVATGKCLAILNDHLRPVHSIAFSPDGKSLASTSDDGTVKLWDAEVILTARDESQEAHVKMFLLSLDGNFVASKLRNGTFCLQDVSSGTPRMLLNDAHAGATNTEFSTDSKLLVTAYKDGRIRVWDLTSGVSQKISFPFEDLSSLHISADSSTIALISKQSTLTLVNSSTGEITKEAQELHAPVHEDAELGTMVLSGDFKLAASSFDDGTIVLWNIEGSKRRETLSGHSEEAFVLAFSPDAGLLASASDDVIKLWDTSTSACVAMLPMSGLVTQLDFIAAASLQTNVGTVLLDGDLSPRVRRVHPGGMVTDDDAPAFVGTAGLGFSQHRNWITWEGQKLVSMPLAYRSLMLKLQGSTIALRSPSGRLLAIVMSPDGSLYKF